MNRQEEVPLYLTSEEATKVAGKLIGLERRLTLFEEGDMFLLGLSRKEIADVTPEELAERADAVAEQSDILLGC